MVLLLQCSLQLNNSHLGSLKHFLIRWLGDQRIGSLCSFRVGVCTRSGRLGALMQVVAENMTVPVDESQGTDELTFLIS